MSFSDNSRLGSGLVRKIRVEGRSWSHGFCRRRSAKLWVVTPTEGACSSVPVVFKRTEPGYRPEGTAQATLLLPGRLAPRLSQEDTRSRGKPAGSGKGEN